MRWMIVCLLAMCLILSACGTNGSATDLNGNEGIGSIKTNNYANKQLDYFYYIPSTATESQKNSFPLLAMIPGLSGRGENFVSQKFKRFADTEGFVIISPSSIILRWSTIYRYPLYPYWDTRPVLNLR